MRRGQRKRRGYITEWNAMQCNMMEECPGGEVIGHRGQCPCTCAVVLGVEVEMVKMELRLPEAKVTKLLELLGTDWEGFVSFTDVCKLAGSLLNASSLCPQTHLFVTRIIDSIWVDSNVKGTDAAMFGPEALKEITFWKKALHKFNGRMLMHEADGKLKTVVCSWVLHSQEVGHFTVLLILQPASVML
jgi:hypothetical protein